MVDVGEKDVTFRTAAAAGRIYISRETLGKIKSGGVKKGDVLTVAQIAGIMGAKHTPDLIPMCHPLPLSGVDMVLGIDEERCCINIEASVSCQGKTGVEMEALTAVSCAALTVYDMCKAIQKDMIIGDIRLLNKDGGVHGAYRAALIKAVCISEEKGTQKHTVDSISLIPDHGILGDAHAGNWHRQVSLLAAESVEKVQKNISFTLFPGAFAENILTEGICLYELPVGTRLRIGTALCEVTQIGKECHHDCAIRKAAGDCVMPREGIFVKVLTPGSARPGDFINIVD